MAEISSLTGPAFALGGVVITAIVSLMVAKVQKKGTPEHKLIDQLQEQVTRADERMDKMDKSLSELRSEVSTLKVRETALMIYVSTLRNHIDQGNPPPPPDWPPGLNPLSD